MRIKEVKISNILSFPYLRDFSRIAGDSFFWESDYSWLKILIGDNASWKSNYITILEEFFLTLTKGYSYDREHILEGKGALRKSIREAKDPTKRLYTNYNNPTKPAKIQISLELSSTDYDNIKFICKHRSKINQIINTYSKLSIRVDEQKLENILAKSDGISLYADFDEKKQEFVIKESSLQEHELFILNCLRYQELFQICIVIFNEFEREASEAKWNLLKNTYTIVNGDRNNVVYENFINPSLIINDINYERKNVSWYIGCVYKVWNILENFAHQQIIAGEKNFVYTKEKVSEALDWSLFFKSLSYAIARYFWRSLEVEYVNGLINFKLLDKNGRVSYFNDLSDGHKSLLGMLLGIYWNDLKDGFMLINEPELHTHPYIQKELAVIFDQVSENIGTEFIVATNSPLLVNEKSLRNVYRLYKDDQGDTKVIAPKISIDYDDASLIHMLRFEHLSKMFFVDKIILVEGDSDAYFFNFYLNHLKKQPYRRDLIDDYEIININGKGSFLAWRRFLNKFKIKNYFIGDWDNTVDYGFFTRAELNKYYQLANKQRGYVKNKKKKYADYYNRLVNTILTFNPRKHKSIIAGIDRLYKERVYILKEGAIETYIPLEKKGLSYVAYFCNHVFHDWLTDPHYFERQKELEGVILSIFWGSKQAYFE